MHKVGLIFSNSTLNEPAVQELLYSDEKFDIIVLEMCMTEALLGFGHHFKIPVIGVSTFGANKYTADLVAAPETSSYIPNLFTGYSDRMSFTERIWNLMEYTLETTLDYFVHQKIQQNLLQYYPDKNMPSISELKKTVSLVLLNTHIAFGFPRPYPPNMIDVGGLHIDRSVKKLPQKLKQFLDDAKYGAIYFSMGSNIKISDITNEKRNAILNSFKLFPQKRIIIKSDINLTISSHNLNDVIVDSWHPQDAILAHPNVKVFITHGGLLSTMETVYYGKPIIGIPVFGDQHLNMKMASHKGIGESIPYETLTEFGLKEALGKVLHNSR